jgi:hypothetical protein
LQHAPEYRKCVGAVDKKGKKMLTSVSGFDMRASRTGPPIDEWAIFQRAQPHALLVGSEASANAAILRLLPYLRAPVVRWQPAALAEPAAQLMGTLVIWDVDTLDRMQQERLLAWIDSHAADVQVISVGKGPVFPLVQRGEFLAPLYYRLNMMLLDVDEQSSRDIRCQLDSERH